MIHGEHRAHIARDYTSLGGGINLWLTVRQGEQMHLVQPAELTYREIDPHVAYDEPTLRLDDGLARALLDALTEHYGGTSNSRQLRADYDAERKRVDRLIGALIPGAEREARGD